jgi:hypothetical protein
LFLVLNMTDACYPSNMGHTLGVCIGRCWLVADLLQRLLAARSGRPQDAAFDQKKPLPPMYLHSPDERIGCQNDFSISS